MAGTVADLDSDQTVQTARLLLRPYELRDFEALCAMAAEPDMFRYSERGPMSSDEAWSRLLRHVGHWNLLGYGIFTVEEKGSGRFVGEAGLGDFRRGLGEPFDGRPEITWSVTAEMQGRGYALEAASAALEWMKRRRPGLATVCLIHAENEPSLRLAEKLGYVPFRKITYKGYPALLFERNA